MKKSKLTIALLIIISFIAILFTTNVYATEAEAVPTTTTVEYEYSITAKNGEQTFKTDETNWYMCVPNNANSSAVIQLKDKTTKEAIEYAQLTEKVVSSDETVLTISDTTGEITLKSGGDATLTHNGETIAKITVYSTWLEWWNSFRQLVGEPVIVVNDNVENYIDSGNTCAVSSVNPPKLEWKLLKNGKIVDLGSVWTPTTTYAYTDYVSIENGIITPKKEGFAQIEMKYNDEVKKIYYLVLEDLDTAKCEIGAYGYRATVAKTDAGKEILVQANTYAYLAYFLNDEMKSDAHKDVFVKIADESIIKHSPQDNEFEAIKTGTTSITVERTGKPAETIKVRVVEDLYQYKEENPNLQFPKDFEIVNAEYIPENNYEKLNTELLDTADTLQVDLGNDNAIVESDVFKTFKEYEDKKLAFTMYGDIDIGYGNITWSFNSEDIKNTDIDVMPKLEISAEKFDNIKTDEVEDGIFIKFLHNGILPGKAEVKIYSYDALRKYGNTPKTLNLYYYNPETNDYENAGTVEFNGMYLCFSIEHCSDYVATELELKGKTDEGAESIGGSEGLGPIDDEPTAGDSNIVVFATFVVIATLGGIVLVTKKK